MSPLAAIQPIDTSLADELEVTFRLHSRLVYRTAYSVTGRAHDAEDVLQTLFLQLLRRGFPPEFQKNPKAYLYRAAVNVSLNIVKARQRHASAADPAHLELVVAAQEADAIVDPDLRTRLVAAIAQLNPRAVEMLILKYEHDASDSEIGRLLGTSRGVVAVTLFRARARLKKLLRPARGEQSPGEKS